ncbi:winged helix-turn-helix domain-containing protein [Streptomyces sp. NBC_00659]
MLLFAFRAREPGPVIAQPSEQLYSSPDAGLLAAVEAAGARALLTFEACCRRGGWPDQTWTLSRIKTLIGHRFHKSMTLSAIAQMLHRHGFSHQVPARRALERNEKAVTGWVKET